MAAEAETGYARATKIEIIPFGPVSSVADERPPRLPGRSHEAGQKRRLRLDDKFHTSMRGTRNSFFMNTSPRSGRTPNPEPRTENREPRTREVSGDSSLPFPPFLAPRLDAACMGETGKGVRGKRGKGVSVQRFDKKLVLPRIQRMARSIRIQSAGAFGNGGFLFITQPRSRVAC